MQNTLGDLTYISTTTRPVIDEDWANLLNGIKLKDNGEWLD